MRLTTGTLLTCDLDTRTLRYRLIPYGEVSRPTSHGTIRVERGALNASTVFPRAYVNLDHDPGAVRGMLTAVEDTDEALIGTVRVFDGPDGDAVLADPPPGASVEVVDPVITDGVLTAGVLIGAAMTPTPAFAGALLTASEATDPDIEDPLDAVPSPPPPPDDPATAPPSATLDPDGTGPGPADPATEDDTVDDETETTETLTETVAPAVATAPVLTAAARTRPATLRAAAEIAAAASRDPNPALLLAALTDITATNTATGQGPNWLGQLWNDEPRTRPFVDSVLHGDLTGIKGPTGWRWNSPPVVAAYTGDKAAVPSAVPTLTAITGVLSRLAGAHDMDRAIFDLGETELIEAYWQAMADSYAELSEDLMSDTLVAGATDATVASGTVLATSATKVIVNAALAVAAVATPTFVGVSSDLFAEFLANPDSAALEFLSGSASFDGTGTLGGLRIFLGKTLAARTVVAGNVKAARFFELPGSPIRAQAVNMPNGGIDVGVFGYASAFVTKPTAVQKIIRPAV